MNSEWSAEMERASDEIILGYIDDYYNFQPEVVYSAIEEARKRNLSIPEDKLRDIKLNVPDPFSTQNIQPGVEMDTYVTVDPDAPALYSQRAIHWCSGIFNVLFGAVMLAVNIRRIGKSNGIAEVLLFGAAYLGVMIWLAEYITGTARGLFIPLNVLGGYIIRGWFWNKYIGEKTLYRKRSVAYPVLIGIGLPVLALIVFILLDLFSR